MRSDFSVGSRLLALLAVGALVLSEPMAGESVNQSRLRFVGLPNASLSISDTELADFCRDEDGCTLTVLLSNAGLTYVDTQRFFLNATPPRWATPLTQNSSDNNGGGEFIAGAVGGGHTCSFSDAEAGGTDDALGYRLFFFMDVGNPATCVMTVID
jgi:hypothetical protein